MLKGKRVEVQVDFDKSARIINATESLIIAFLEEVLPSNYDTEEDLKAVAYLREKMNESKELFCSVLVSLQDQLVVLCGKYMAIAQNTDNIIKEIEKIEKKDSTRKVN